MARAVPGPFEPPSWGYVGEDGTFGNRFDDPRMHLPEVDRFRVIYCATERQVAFAETLARMRPSLRSLAGIRLVDDDDALAPSVPNASDPEFPYRGLIGENWRLPRVIGHTILNADMPFVDLGTASTSQYLRSVLAREAVEHGATDIDQSLLMESNRGFTRVVARHFYEQLNEDGSAKFAGIRYISRHDTNWECWAVFADRMIHIPGMPGFPETIYPDDPDLLQIAGLFDLTIEIMSGYERYYRP